MVRIDAGFLFVPKWVTYDADECSVVDGTRVLTVREHISIYSDRLQKEQHGAFGGTLKFSYRVHCSSQRLGTPEASRLALIFSSK